MANLLVDERDVNFVLFEQLEISRLFEGPAYAEYSEELAHMVLDAARKLAEKELWPARPQGDAEGVSLENGSVRAPACFHAVYERYREGGWPSLPIDTEHGGQGAPISLACAVNEVFVAGNLPFMSYPELSIGAGRVIQRFGTEQQQRDYMAPLYSGQWTGTMCLTEPQAGSDVGALRTKAVKQGDGAYAISGSKIFISCGDHDLAENIVHLVLARIEGAPPGTKGISLFIVPKKRIENGSLVPNDVTTASTEKKLGLHGSATCALNFGDRDDCVGYLLGEEHSGMAIMFTMMNEARLAVGLQGLAQASGAYMHALRYARERVQGVAIHALRDPGAERLPIIEHPDVRRMILWMKSVTEGMRALLYYAGYCEDRMVVATSDDERSRYSDMVDLIIPVCKAWCSDMGFRVTEMAIQVYGGYGYCREYPVEQFLRDAKITSIYEGTNGIQALDLIGRKLTRKQGALFAHFLNELNQLVHEASKDPRLQSIGKTFHHARTSLIEATTFMGKQALAGDVTLPALYATQYLELFGDITVGGMLLRQAGIASARLADIYGDRNVHEPEAQNRLLCQDPEAAFYAGKIASAEFFATNVLALASGKARAITSGYRSPLELPTGCFGT